MPNSTAPITDGSTRGTPARGIHSVRTRRHSSPVRSARVETLWPTAYSATSR